MDVLLFSATSFDSVRVLVLVVMQFDISRNAPDQLLKLKMISLLWTVAVTELPTKGSDLTLLLLFFNLNLSYL
jgi:hypothetical protein